MTVIELHIEKKTYRKKFEKVLALNDFYFTASRGEKVAVVGESGAGKSTLLNILGLLDTDYTGTYNLLERNARGLSNKQMSDIRNRSLGFVLQESALIDSFTIEDNIKLPLFYAERSKVEEGLLSFERIVRDIDIKHILKKKPLQCSGGEKARAAFARAVILEPSIILADEPTASLDAENRERIVNYLFKMNLEHGSTVVTVTHDLEIAEKHDRVVDLGRKDR